MGSPLTVKGNPPVLKKVYIHLESLVVDAA